MDGDQGFIQKKKIGGGGGGKLHAAVACSYTLQCGLAALSLLVMRGGGGGGGGLRCLGGKLPPTGRNPDNGS